MVQAMEQLKKIHQHTFPPFPVAPAGTVITPFNEFQERGISTISISDIEVDANGIPTIALPNRHTTDRCKTDAAPRIAPKTRSTTNAIEPGGRRVEFWEEWEALDASRGRLGYNPTLPRTDRFQKAVQDFNKNRTWPNTTTGFQKFIGQIDSTQPRATKKPEEDEDNDDDDLDDEDDELDVKATHDASPKAKEEVKDKDDDMEIDDDDTFGGIENSRMMAFLNDPEKRTKIYLSSAMRRQGLHFLDRNLVVIPRLLYSFLNYLVENRVFADKNGDEVFRDALRVVEIALIELPKTATLARLLPDNFNGALKEVYNTKKTAVAWPTEEVKEPSNSEETTTTTTSNWGNGSSGTTSSWGNGGSSWGTQPSNSEETETATTTENGTSETTNSWGNEGSSGWSTTINSETIDAWNTSAADGWDMDTEDDDNVNPADAWLAPPPSLVPILGPTTLPMTHKTGIVEWSVRRIKSITPPPPVPPPKAVSSPFTTEHGYGDPLAVEAELAKTLHKVEMEPWLGWESGFQEPEAVLPRVLEVSKGAVVIQDNVVFEDESKGKVGVEEGNKTTVYTSASGVKPHKPSTDAIMILALPAVAEQMRLGMGLGGTWVQLLREGDLVGDSVQQEKKGKGKTAGQRFWYMEELMVTLTSYHTV